jgi:hypothetical protein
MARSQQEMVMAAWLIAKGFSSSPIATELAGEASKWQTAAPRTAPPTSLSWRARRAPEARCQPAGFQSRVAMSRSAPSRLQRQRD